MPFLSRDENNSEQRRFIFGLVWCVCCAGAGRRSSEFRSGKGGNGGHQRVQREKLHRPSWSCVTGRLNDDGQDATLRARRGGRTAGRPTCTCGGAPPGPLAGAPCGLMESGGPQHPRDDGGAPQRLGHRRRRQDRPRPRCRGRSCRTAPMSCSAPVRRAKAMQTHRRRTHGGARGVVHRMWQGTTSWPAYIENSSAYARRLVDTAFQLSPPPPEPAIKVTATDHRTCAPQQQ